MAQMLIQGRNSLPKLAEMAEKLNIRRPMIVGWKEIAEKLPVQGVLFDEYHPNPDFDDCHGGVELYRSEHCDGIISIGGGSTIDTAKVIKVLLLTDTKEQALHGRLTASGSMIPHIAVPTSAGTGSEATCNAVVYSDGMKYSVGHPDLLPEGVILDSSLLDSLPLYHKKSCALDALAQGIESYWAKGATEDSQVHAFLAITGVLGNLRAYLDGDPKAADEMIYASYQSGCAIHISKTTAAHAMSYQLTKTLNYAHGHACMLTLPYLWEQMQDNPEMLPTLMDLAQKMKLGSEYLPPKLLKGMLIDLGMEFDKKPEDDAAYDALADSVNIERLGNHPVALTREDLKRIYKKAFTPLNPMERQVCIDLWKYYGK